MRILLAEDNPTNEKIARQLLAKLGHTCATASNGLEVLEIMRRGETFDCILMDVAMPKMDGIEATRRLIEEMPNSAQRPPVIAVTANAFDSDRKRCFAAGMSGFIAKPVTLAVLRDTLENLEAFPESAVVEPSGDIDFEHFDSIIGGGNAEAVAIFNDFCVNVMEQIARMESGASSGDAKAFGGLAHQLKGSLATFGLARLSQQMGELETAAASGNLSQLPNTWASEASERFLAAEKELRLRL